MVIVQKKNPPDHLKKVWVSNTIIICRTSARLLPLYSYLCLIILFTPTDHNSGPHRVVDKLFSNTRYFVIKSNNFENVEIAKSKVGASYNS